MPPPPAAHALLGTPRFRYGSAATCEVRGEVVTGLSEVRPVGGPLRVAFERADLPLQASLGREELKKLAEDRRSPRAGVAGQLLALLDNGEKLPAHYACPLAVWQFG